MEMELRKIAFDSNEGIFARYRNGFEVDSNQIKAIYDTAKNLNAELKEGKISNPSEFVLLLVIARKLAICKDNEYAKVSKDIVDIVSEGIE